MVDPPISEVRKAGQGLGLHCLWFVLWWQNWRLQRGRLGTNRGLTLPCLQQELLGACLAPGSPSTAVPSFFIHFMQWFGFYKSGQAKETIPLQETSLYKEVSSGGWGLVPCPLFAVPEAPQLCSCHSWGIACPCQELFCLGRHFPPAIPGTAETQGMALVAPAWLRIPLSSAPVQSSAARVP